MQVQKETVKIKDVASKSSLDNETIVLLSMTWILAVQITVHKK